MCLGPRARESLVCVRATESPCVSDRACKQWRSYVSLSVYLFVPPQCACVCVVGPVYTCVFECVSVFVSLCLCLFVSVSMCLSVCPSVRPSVCSSIFSISMLPTIGVGLCSSWGGPAGKAAISDDRPTNRDLDAHAADLTSYW
jgi:hypothetical protein